MKTLIAIGLGGFFGAISRFGLTQLVQSWLGNSFPFGILIANIVGSLLLGFFAQTAQIHLTLSEAWRAAIAVGFLGAFTTFSSFSYETLLLIDRGEQIAALANVFSNVFLCLSACWFGMWLSKVLF